MSNFTVELAKILNNPTLFTEKSNYIQNVKAVTTDCPIENLESLVDQKFSIFDVASLDTYQGSFLVLALQRLSRWKSILEILDNSDSIFLKICAIRGLSSVGLDKKVCFEELIVRLTSETTPVKIKYEIIRVLKKHFSKISTMITPEVIEVVRTICGEKTAHRFILKSDFSENFEKVASLLSEKTRSRDIRSVISRTKNLADSLLENVKTTTPHRQIIFDFLGKKFSGKKYLDQSINFKSPKYLEWFLRRYVPTKNKLDKTIFSIDSDDQTEKFFVYCFENEKFFNDNFLWIVRIWVVRNPIRVLELIGAVSSRFSTTVEENSDSITDHFFKSAEILRIIWDKKTMGKVGTTKRLNLSVKIIFDIVPVVSRFPHDQHNRRHDQNFRSLINSANFTKWTDENVISLLEKLFLLPGFDLIELVYSAVSRENLKRDILRLFIKRILDGRLKIERSDAFIYKDKTYSELWELDYELLQKFVVYVKNKFPETFNDLLWFSELLPFSDELFTWYKTKCNVGTDRVTRVQSLIR